MTTPLVLDQAAQDLLFREARTANTFTDEPVSPEQVREIYELVKFGPTSMNIQPLRIVILESEQAKKRLIPLMSPGNQAKTEKAPLVAILAADKQFQEHLPRVFPIYPEARSNFEGDEQRDAMRGKIAEFNAALQTGYFLIGIRAAGLAAGPMAGFDRAGVDQEFFPDGRFGSFLVVNIGKPGPDAWFDRLPRLEHDEVVTWL